MRLVAVVVAAALAMLAGASVARADVVVTVPADIVAEAQGPTGAQVTYQASAREDESGTDKPISCTNPGGSTSDGVGTIQPTVLFPLGATTVTCSTTGESASFTVTVQDTTPPTVTPPPPVTAEATGPGGAVASYGAASASDLVDGSVTPTCAPASGSTFPLGSTTVTCSAADSAGNTGSATTTVLVHDTTPPVVTPPRDITVVAPAGVSSLPPSDPSIAAFLAGATATDTVDPHPVVTASGPTSYPVGFPRRVTFTATDQSGNSASAAATVTVVAPTGGSPPPPPPPPPPPSSPPPPPPPAQRPDRTPPAEASAFKLKAGDHRVLVTWSVPKDADFDHVVLVRSTTRGKQAQKVVYTGRGRSFTDRRLSNNVTFRYTLSTVDRTGNRSDGVSATARPHTIYLVKPADGARIRKPPTLLWVPKTKAFYYNVQLYRGSTKVLSAWPSRNRFVLGSTWTYKGHRYRLIPGTYRWYVWPGIGPRRYAKYGKLLGQNTFVYAPSVY
jgi:hypothetical protein